MTAFAQILIGLLLIIVGSIICAQIIGILAEGEPS